MNLQVSYQEIKDLLSKKAKNGVTIEKIEFCGDAKFNVTIVKPTLLTDLSADVELTFRELVDKDIVVDVQLGGKFLSWWQKFATIKWIKESHLEWLMREMFDMEGLISIDEEKRDRLTFHLDRIEALKKTLELLELGTLYFDESGIEIEMYTL